MSALKKLVIGLGLADHTDATGIKHNAFPELGGDAKRPAIVPTLWNPSEAETVTIEIAPGETLYGNSIFAHDDPDKGGLKGVKFDCTAKTIFKVSVPLQGHKPRNEHRSWAQSSIKDAKNGGVSEAAAVKIAEQQSQIDELTAQVAALITTLNANA